MLQALIINLCIQASTSARHASESYWSASGGKRRCGIVKGDQHLCARSGSFHTNKSCTTCINLPSEPEPAATPGSEGHWRICSCHQWTNEETTKPIFSCLNHNMHRPCQAHHAWTGLGPFSGLQLPPRNPPQRNCGPRSCWAVAASVALQSSVPNTPVNHSHTFEFAAINRVLNILLIKGYAVTKSFNDFSKKNKSFNDIDT